MKHIKTTSNSTAHSQSYGNDYSHHLETLDNSDIQYLRYLRSKQIKRNKWLNY